ncbi:hypothetical protein D3C72_597450 [compost metagenome]
MVAVAPKGSVSVGLVTAPDCHSELMLPSTERAAVKVPLVWLALTVWVPVTGAGVGRGAPTLPPWTSTSKSMIALPPLSKVSRTYLPQVSAGSFFSSTFQVVFFWPVRATFQLWASSDTSTV